MYQRIYQKHFKDWLKPGKVLVVYGARQVGKTTLIKEYLNGTKYKTLFVSGEDMRVQEVLGSRSIEVLRDFVSGYELLVVDEAQKVPQIGEALKLLVDHISDLRVVATGSASFDLANKIGEPLTGRKTTRILYPLSLHELAFTKNRSELKTQLGSLLIYGSYPNVLNAKNSTGKKDYLNELVGSYLLKDIFELERVRNPRVVLNLLRLLAFQIGKDVSRHELAKQLGIDDKTVARYLDLLEKGFVIQSIGGLSRNLRKEIAKNQRYIFFDNGIRNAIISNFNDLTLRDDTGALWENFVTAELIKNDTYRQEHGNFFFWRTHDQKEIDVVIEKEGCFFAYEVKFSPSTVKIPKDFAEAYPKHKFTVVTKENFLSVLLSAKE